MLEQAKCIFVNTTVIQYIPIADGVTVTFSRDFASKMKSSFVNAASELITQFHKNGINVTPMAIPLGGKIEPYGFLPSDIISIRVGTKPNWFFVKKELERRGLKDVLPVYFLNPELDPADLIKQHRAVRRPSGSTPPTP